MPLRTTIATVTASAAVFAGAIGQIPPAAAESNAGPLTEYGFIEFETDALAGIHVTCNAREFIANS